MNYIDLYTYTKRHELKGIIIINDAFSIIRGHFFDDELRKVVLHTEKCFMVNGEKQGYSIVYHDKKFVEEVFYL